MAIQWTREQKQVIDSRNCSILVSAAAGSGKTAVLSARILALIMDREHPLDIDRLLVVTFTNAAASEMRERIRKNLEKELEKDPENLHLQRQISLIHNASIMTIDSFCLQVVRSHFYLTDLDPGFRMADPGELDLLRADVCDAVLNQFYESEDPAFLKFTENYSGAKTDAPIGEMILKLYDYSRSYPWPQEWLASCTQAYRVSENSLLEEQDWCRELTGFFHDCICDIEEQLSSLLELTALPGGPVMYQEALESDLLQARHLKECKTIAEWQQAMEQLAFQRLKSARKFEGDDSLREYVKGRRDALKKELQSWQKKYFTQDPAAVQEQLQETGRMAEQLVRLTGVFSERYMQEKKKRNVIDFSDCEHLALQILVDPETKEITDAAREYQHQFAEVMVDEYQDSNFVQEALLTAVSGISGGRENYFTVGDVKQSIYRFRLARPELFMKKYETYRTQEDEPSASGGREMPGDPRERTAAGGEPSASGGREMPGDPRERAAAGGEPAVSEYQNKRRIDLHQNFRSRTEVIDFVNHIFRKAMRRDIGNVVYDADAALYPGGDFSGDPAADYRPEILLCENSGGAANARQREAELIARRIRNLIDGREIPGISYGDIVILMRSPSRCAEIYQEVLSSYGIPVHVQSQTGYFSAMEVRLVLEMLKLIDNPLQDIPMASVMHSYFGKFTAEEMAEIKAAFPELRFFEAVFAYEKKPEETALVLKVRDFLSMLSEFREMVPYTPIHLLLEEIFRRTGFYYYARALPSGKQRRANLDMLVQRAIDYEKTSYQGLLHFNRYIELLRKYDVDYGEADVTSEAEDAVRLMSIHKSKGLEFPVVFLSDAGGDFNTLDEKSNIVFHPDYGFGLKYINKDRHVKADTLIRQAFALDTRRENLGEELRVLYVALTRAEKKLIITGNCKEEKVSGSRGAEVPDWGSGKETSAVNEDAACFEKDRGLSFFERFHAGSYLDFIIPATADDQNCLKKWISGEELEAGRNMAGQQESSRRQERLREAYESDREAEEEISSLFSWKYPYEGETLPVQKLSVSELKKRAMEQGEQVLTDQDQQRLIREEIPSPYIPKFASETQEEPSGAGYGTAMHRFLRYVDYTAFPEERSRETIQAFVSGQIAEMMAKGQLDQETAGRLSLRSLTRFMQSAVAGRISEAARRGDLYREQPFMMAVEARRIWDHVPAGESVLVQGIIDIFWMEKDGIVLMDYKTDRVQAPQKLLDRYATQLNLYRKAVAEFYPELRVKEAYIYSLFLGEIIPVAE